jgi:hypothetical protein
MYGDFPARNTVYTPYKSINEWFWLTLHMGLSSCCTWLTTAVPHEKPRLPPPSLKLAHHVILHALAASMGSTRQGAAHRGSTAAGTGMQGGGMPSMFPGRNFPFPGVSLPRMQTPQEHVCLMSVIDELLSIRL